MTDRCREKDDEIKDNHCPRCGTFLTSKWSGVECKRCGWWFCY